MKKYIMAVLISLSALQVVALVTLKKDPGYRDARRNGAQTRLSYTSRMMTERLCRTPR